MMIIRPEALWMPYLTDGDALESITIQGRVIDIGYVDEPLYDIDPSDNAETDVQTALKWFGNRNVRITIREVPP